MTLNFMALRLFVKYFANSKASEVTEWNMRIS